jgi:ketosteroid isomerase-like protein
MSQENVEIVRRGLDAWNRRDVDALLNLGDFGIEFVNSPTAVEPGTRRGRDEVSAAVRTQWDFLTDGRFEVDQFFDRGDEIIALGRLSRRMPGSDARIEDHRGRAQRGGPARCVEELEPLVARIAGADRRRDGSILVLR